MSVAPIGGAPASPAAADAPRDPRAAEAAAGFERILLGQLTKTLVDSAMGERPGPHAALLPEALADALAAGGGIGIATALDRGAGR